MKTRTALTALAVSLAAILPALPASASTKPTPSVGATINVAAIPGADGAYQVTLLQVYNNIAYATDFDTKAVASHPVVARFRVTDTGSASLAEDPQKDVNALLFGHDYPTWAVDVDGSGTAWQLSADYNASGLANLAGRFSNPPGCSGKGANVTYNCTGTCPTPTVQVAQHAYTYGDIDIIPGSAAETCVVFSLPVTKDRTTFKLCWTPDDAVTLQQPTYCWTVNNDKPGAV